MKSYDHLKIEKKWQKEWEKKKIYEAKDPGKTQKPKYYSLIEFPYPSGDGLHVGHPRPYIGMDVISRKRRMEGYNVLYPIGWDAFGLPTENYAIKTGKDPKIVTKQNTDTFRRQIKSLGISFDWSREVNTTDPKYYKWTQWIFLQFFNKGLAYKAKAVINWCPSCKIGLANEEVVAGTCERCGTEVVKREKEQWMLGITKYAERLDKDLDTVDYLPQIKLAQRNWIGKSEGAEIEFSLGKEKIKVFTTRPDTIFGATYLVLAPEHSLVESLKIKVGNKNEVKEYIKKAKKKTEIERTTEGKAKTGVELKGVKAINPANKEEIPVWIADYVLPHYGTGAIMAVPAHDERDFEFAKKYSLPVRIVITHSGTEIPYTGEGIMANSGKFDGMDSEKAKKEITKFVGGKEKTTFKLRDWIFSRQRYWGEPIPIIHCEDCGYAPVPEKDLPVLLPKVKNYQPTESGESPLAKIKNFVDTRCPLCKGKAKRETDTMPNWAGSSWYYLRYVDPKNAKAFADKKKLAYWTPVDWYNGGYEHTTLHLLYSRFWHKFLFDLGLVPTAEPYKKRTSHGIILAEGGEKMSKSKGNVINPDDIVKRYGADTLRVYEMFMGPFDQAIAWSEEAIIGPRRFLEKVWKLASRIQKNSAALPASGLRHGQNFSVSASLGSRRENFSVPNLLHKTIKKVSEDIEAMKFNTAISTLMIFINEVEKNNFQLSTFNFKTFLKLLSPFAPHLTEEIWQRFDHQRSIHLEPWPAFDASKIASEEITFVVQVNGKVRGQFKAAKNIDQIEATNIAEKLQEIQKWIEGKKLKFIFVPGKLINIVI